MLALFHCFNLPFFFFWCLAIWNPLFPKMRLNTIHVENSLQGIGSCKMQSLCVSVHLVFILILSSESLFSKSTLDSNRGYVIGRSASITDAASQLIAQRICSAWDTGAYFLCEVTLEWFASLCVLELLNKCFLRYSYKRKKKKKQSFSKILLCFIKAQWEPAALFMFRYSYSMSNVMNNQNSNSMHWYSFYSRYYPVSKLYSLNWHGQKITIAPCLWLK